MLFQEEFVLFEYIFENISIKIYFQKYIYRKYHVVIRNIFKIFQCTSVKFEQLQKGLYICYNQDVQIPIESEIYMYDVASNDWIFELLTDVETYIINKLKITVFHGAAVCRNEHLVLIIGKRKSGKSTLTHFLVENGWNLIDDDCIYFDTDSVFGMGFPLRLRKMIYDSKRVFATCMDLDGEKRHLLSAPYYSLCVKTEEVTIVFPEYTQGSPFKKSIITKMQLFTMLLHNVRFSIDEIKSLRDVTYLMKFANSGYSVVYSKCSDVNLFLKELLKVEEE